MLSDMVKRAIVLAHSRVSLSVRKMYRSKNHTPKRTSSTCRTHAIIIPIYNDRIQNRLCECISRISERFDQLQATKLSSSRLEQRGVCLSRCVFSPKIYSRVFFLENFLYLSARCRANPRYAHQTLLSLGIEDDERGSRVTAVKRTFEEVFDKHQEKLFGHGVTRLELSGVTVKKWYSNNSEEEKEDSMIFTNVNFLSKSNTLLSLLNFVKELAKKLMSIENVYVYNSNDCLSSRLFRHVSLFHTQINNFPFKALPQQICYEEKDLNFGQQTFDRIQFCSKSNKEDEYFKIISERIKRI